jgi:hypothetical protein
MAKSKLYAVKKKTGEDDKKPDTSKKMVSVKRVTPKKPKTTVSAIRKAMDVKKPAPKKLAGRKRDISFAGGKIESRKPRKTVVKKKLATPEGGFKTAKVTYKDANGKPHGTKAGMLRANKRIKGNTQTGDYNPRSDRKQD